MNNIWGSSGIMVTSIVEFSISFFKYKFRGIDISFETKKNYEGKIIAVVLTSKMGVNLKKFCLFVTDATQLLCQDQLQTRELCQSPMQVTAVTAESFMLPVLDVFLTPQHAN